MDEGVIVGTVARVNSQQEIRGVSLHSSLALVLGNKSPALRGIRREREHQRTVCIAETLPLPFKAVPREVL